KPSRCVVSTAEPHLAYDCSALALESLKLIYTNTKKQKDVLFLIKNGIVRFYFDCMNDAPASSTRKRIDLANLIAKSIPFVLTFEFLKPTSAD
uniref:hypothetical protein n=1 Tax=Lacticaseibacillus rhamnosus TaxID=47715 RepID=UPI000519721B